MKFRVLKEMMANIVRRYEDDFPFGKSFLTFDRKIESNIKSIL